MADRPASPFSRSAVLPVSIRYTFASDATLCSSVEGIAPAGITWFDQAVRVTRSSEDDGDDQMSMNEPTMSATVRRGVVAGLAGTAVMTAFQKLVEMPLTGRSDSDAPASFAEKVLPMQLKSEPARKRVNYGTHFALGTIWGVAYGLAARSGLRGQRAVAAVFVTVYTGDVLLNTALGLYEPLSWTRRDWVIDVVDKLVQAEATGAVFDRIVGGAPLSGAPQG